MVLSEADRNELREAKASLEHRGLADRLTELIGAPVVASFRMLPDSVESKVSRVIEKTLQLALDVALRTLDDEGKTRRPKLLTHKLLAGFSGAAGGAFGGAAIAAELPVSTILILRSVADIARSEGEDLNQVEARLACLQVFALGSRQPPIKNSEQALNDETEIGYFAVRAAMAKQIRDASQYVVTNGLSNTTAPPLVRLIAQIGEKFGVVVSEKLAAQALPVIGAIGGALINSYFIDHYQDLARAHFTIRRLEREYGETTVQQAYFES